MQIQIPKSLELYLVEQQGQDHVPDPHLCVHTAGKRVSYGQTGNV